MTRTNNNNEQRDERMEQRSLRSTGEAIPPQEIIAHFSQESSQTVQQPYVLTQVADNSDYDENEVSEEGEWVSTPSSPPNAANANADTISKQEALEQEFALDVETESIPEARAIRDFTIELLKDQEFEENATEKPLDFSELQKRLETMTAMLAPIQTMATDIAGLKKDMTTKAELREEITAVKEEIKSNTEAWFKEKSELIKMKLQEADQTMKSFTKEQTEVVQELVAKKVNEKMGDIAAEELKDAKEKITKYAESALKREEEHKQCINEAKQITARMAEYEKKYGSTSKDADNTKKTVQEYAKKLSKMEDEMKELVRTMEGFKAEAAKAIGVYGKMSTLATSVEKRQTLIEKTAEECNRTMDILHEFNTETVPNIKSAEITCKDAAQAAKREVIAVEKMYEKIVEQDKLRAEFASQMAAVRLIFEEFNKVKPLVEETAANVNNYTALRGEVEALRIAQLERPRTTPIVTDEKIRTVVKKVLGIGQPNKGPKKDKEKNEGYLMQLVKELVKMDVEERLELFAEGRGARMIEEKVEEMARAADMEAQMENAVKNQLEVMKEQNSEQPFTAQQVNQVMALFQEHAIPPHKAEQYVKSLMPTKAQMIQWIQEDNREFEKETEESWNQRYTKLQEEVKKLEAKAVEFETKEREFREMVEEAQASMIENISSTMQAEAEKLSAKKNDEVEAIVPQNQYYAGYTRCYKGELIEKTVAYDNEEHLKLSRSNGWIRKRFFNTWKEAQEWQNLPLEESTPARDNRSKSSEKERKQDARDQEGEEGPVSFYAGYSRFNQEGKEIQRRIASTDAEHLKIARDLEWIRQKIFSSKEEANEWIKQGEQEQPKESGLPKTPWAERAAHGQPITPPSKGPPIQRRQQFGSPRDTYERFTDEELKSQFDESPDGYFENGEPYCFDEQGRKIPTHRPFRQDLAGRRVPSESTCRNMAEEFHREEYGMDYFEEMGSGRRSYGSRSSDRREDRYNDHPSRRTEYRNPHLDPPIREQRRETIEDRDTFYLMGEHGTAALQPSDFDRLGFHNPVASAQVLIAKHARLVRGYERMSRYDGAYSCGPDAKALISSTAFQPLESTKQKVVIPWFDRLGLLLESYQVALVPFPHIELAYGPVGLCIPGVGRAKYDEMGRALALLLTTKLLPMMADDADSKLAQALSLSANPEAANGYEILHMLLKKTVNAFDDEDLELPWPQYQDFDTPMKFAEAVRVTEMLAAKRRQPVRARDVALQFLQKIINEAGPNYRVQAQILRKEVKKLPPNLTTLPAEYSLKAMAIDISESKGKEPTEPELRRPRANRTEALEGREEVMDKAVQSGVQSIQSGMEWMQIDQSTNGGEWNEHMQGHHARQYCINEMYRPAKNGYRRPNRRPVPDAAKTDRKRSNMYDPTIVCNACGQRGHPANKCFALAVMVYVKDYATKRNNEETIQSALKFWQERNAPALKDAKTKEPLQRTPQQIMRTYCDRYGHDIDKIRDELDWEYFEAGSSEREAFGATLTGESVTYESE